MKHRVTQKEMRNGYHVFSVGYCELQYLLYFVEPQFYNAGLYGWNCDYYVFHNKAICTGYRPHGKQVAYETIQHYDKLANKILYDAALSYDEKKAKMGELLNQFVKDELK